MKRLLLLSLSVLLPAALFAIADIGRQPSAFGRIVPVTVTYDGASELGKGPFAEVPIVIALSTNAIPGFTYEEISKGRFVCGVEYQIGTTTYITEYPHEVKSWQPDGVSEIWVRVPALGTEPVSFNIYYMYDVDVSPADVWDGAFTDYASFDGHLGVSYGEIYRWREPAPEFSDFALGHALDPYPEVGYYWVMAFTTIQGPSEYTVFAEFADVVDYSVITNIFYDTSFGTTDVPYTYSGVVDMMNPEFPLEDLGVAFGFSPNRFYSARVIAEAEIDGEATTAFLRLPNLVFSGELTVEKLRDAVESETDPVPAVVRISLPSGVTAPAGGFRVPFYLYPVDFEEEMTAGLDFEEVTSATIPEGMSSVVVEIWPYVSAVDHDVEIQLFVDQSASVNEARTTFVIYDRGSADAPEIVCRWLHGDAASPCLSLAEALSYASYGDTVSIVGDASKETVELKPGVAIEVADGGTAPAKENLSVPSCYKLTWNGDTPVLTLDADEVRPASGAVTAGGKSFTVTVENAHKGLLYGLAFAETLDGLNAATPADWTRAAADGPLSVSVDPHGATSAFARLVVTDVPLSKQ